MGGGARTSDGQLRPCVLLFTTQRSLEMLVCSVELTSDLVRWHKFQCVSLTNKNISPNPPAARRSGDVSLVPLTEKERVFSVSAVGHGKREALSVALKHVSFVSPLLAEERASTVTLVWSAYIPRIYRHVEHVVTSLEFGTLQSVRVMCLGSGARVIRGPAGDVELQQNWHCTKAELVKTHSTSEPSSPAEAFRKKTRAIISHSGSYVQPIILFICTKDTKLHITRQGFAIDSSCLRELPPGTLNQSIADITMLVDKQTDGGILGVWLMAEVDHWNNEKERLVILTDHSLLVFKYDFLMFNCEQLQRIPLHFVDRITHGDFSFPKFSVLNRKSEGQKMVQGPRLDPGPHLWVQQLEPVRAELKQTFWLFCDGTRPLGICETRLCSVKRSHLGNCTSSESCCRLERLGSGSLKLAVLEVEAPGAVRSQRLHHEHSEVT
ncbi:hypothetical protein WMY93_024370 [Mugilogobius chulae]|uniref:HSac2 domain-containing protein n=1 Tax=Mugilogobius chulae TaxID=88201 RepID=A0AAW0N495_9GOBI